MTSGPPRIAGDWGVHVAGEIRAIAARRGISHARIARRIGRTPMWLSRRLSPSTIQPMTLEELTLIADALGVDPLDVLAAGRAAAERQEA